MGHVVETGDNAQLPPGGSSPFEKKRSTRTRARWCDPDDVKKEVVSRNKRFLIRVCTGDVPPSSPGKDIGI